MNNNDCRDGEVLDPPTLHYNIAIYKQKLQNIVTIIYDYSYVISVWSHLLTLGLLCYDFGVSTESGLLLTSIKFWLVICSFTESEEASKGKLQRGM